MNKIVNLDIHTCHCSWLGKKRGGRSCSEVILISVYIIVIIIFNWRWESCFWWVNNDIIGEIVVLLPI